MNENLVKDIVAEVLSRLQQSGAGLNPTQPAIQKKASRPGVFATAEEAVAAARGAFEQLQKKGFAARVKAVGAVKELCSTNASEWGRIEFEETRIGRLDHKVAKLKGIPGLPGIEFLSPLGMTGDHGLSVEENAPFGVIAAITPVTHSIPTLAANAVSMIAAGNAVAVNAHPGGARCAAMAVAAFNEAIEQRTGITNLITIIEEPTLDSFNALCKSPEIDLICVTGGPGVVKAAMQSGKRAVCAGPGNPPVVVDETARLDKAARSIIVGGAFDNNLLCIGEKQVFVVEKVFREFMAAMDKAGAVRLSAPQLAALTSEAFKTSEGVGGCSKPVLNRKLIGADAAVLARHAGTSAPESCELLFAEADFDHPFVQEEQMMPMVPVVRVRDVDEAIEKARLSEHGYKHSAMIHSRDIEAMTRMGRVMDCTLFVKNGPCIAGLGMGGEGYASFSVATATGEGITTPMTFTRKRRCVMVDQLNLVV
jgi:aldehyde dehydrogenase